MAKKKSKTQRIVTSIKIDPEIWKQAKIAAIELGIDTCQLLEEAIQNYLKTVTTKKECSVMSELKTVLTCVKCGETIRNPKTHTKTCPKCGGTLAPRTIKLKRR